MVLSLLLCQGLAAQPAPPAVRATQAGRLRDMAAERARQFADEHAAAVRWAADRNIPMRVEHNGTLRALVAMHDGRPVYLITSNVDAADSASTDELWPGGISGLNLDGTGVKLHEWDGGRPKGGHQELSGAMTWADDTNYGLSDHSTHVAGTMVAAGVSPTARGMAYNATLDSYDWYDDMAEMAAAASNGARVSNHSYSFITGWAFNALGDGQWAWFGNASISAVEDYNFGFYTNVTQAWDQIAFDAPWYLIVKSAGNDRNDDYVGGHWVWALGSWQWSTAARDPDGGADGYDSIGSLATAKNILTVGAVDDIPGGWTSAGDVVMSSFSGWGPTDDGRIKPDLVANGVLLRSCVASSTTSYAYYSGTSMSSPSVAGSLGLLVQHHRAGHGGFDMRAAALKGLAIHTADEAGAAPGPDYEFGWGMLNALAAAQQITLDETQPWAVQELSIAQGETIQQTLQYTGSGPIKATICWTDPPGTPSAPSLNPVTLRLVNDLDLRVIGPDLTVYQPWVLDPANPADPATTGDNDRDNVEVVLVSAPGAGDYTVEVTHKGVISSGPQDYALILTGLAPLPGAEACPPGEIADCGGNCVPEDWWGDGVCDAAFQCAEMGFDDNDCQDPSTGIAAADFDGDGKADLLRRDNDAKRGVVWLMDGRTIDAGSGVVDDGADPVQLGTGWLPIAVGDYDGDGRDDVMWRNKNNAALKTWLMDGATMLAGSGPVENELGDPLSLGSAWQALGAGDFDGDGKADLLMYRPSNGKVKIWMMDGIVRRAGAGGLVRNSGGTPLVVAGAWTVAAIDDFDQDGRADILQRNTFNKKCRIWFMDGTTALPLSGVVEAPGGGAQLLGANWSVAGTGDYDGDGFPDVLWRNERSKKARLWLMAVFVTKATSGLIEDDLGDPALLGASWVVKGTGDFDGDGFCDVFWRHPNGSERFWLMQDLTMQATSGPVPE